MYFGGLLKKQLMAVMENISDEPLRFTYVPGLQIGHLYHFIAIFSPFLVHTLGHQDPRKGNCQSELIFIYNK